MEVENQVVKTIPHHTEFESKYRVDGDKIYEFKKIVENLDGYNFLYIQGPDYYFTKEDGSFLRYRKAENDNKNRAEVTMKEKPEDAKNNIIRKEVNWRVDKTPYNTIKAGALMQGYDYNFRIWKMCHIYNFKDATVVFYTVKDDNEKLDHFIEIEVDEDTIHKLTEKEAWMVIEKYEAIFEPLGITYRNRLRKSLYEMYVKDIYKEKVVL